MKHDPERRELAGDSETWLYITDGFAVAVEVRDSRRRDAE
jgi:hypothetical protein